MKLESLVGQNVVNAVKELYGVEIAPESVQLQKTKKEWATLRSSFFRL